VLRHAVEADAPERGTARGLALAVLRDGDLSVVDEHAFFRGQDRFDVASDLLG
jgi:hypothetical protein